METTTLDLTAPGGELLASAAYFAVLAYPESHHKRDKAVTAIFAYMNRAARVAGKPLSPNASELFQEVPARAQRERLGHHSQKGMLPRIRRRNLAAQAAQTMLSGGNSLRDLARAYEGSESYFLHTVWAESKPVLALALGLRSTVRYWRDDGRPIYMQLLLRLGWVREAMHHAENWRQILTAIAGSADAPEFARHLDPDGFIRLLPHCADSPTTP